MDQARGHRGALHWLAAVLVPLMAWGGQARTHGGGTMAPEARTYHVDATKGDDGNDGLSPAGAWRTLARVKAAALRAGDTVRFRRGQSWRGQLVPRSGDETGQITYAAYGEGEKPLLLGSVARNRPEDWRHEGGDIWATAKVEGEPLDVDVGNIIFDHGAAIGVKKWQQADLKRQGDFWYDGRARQVRLHSTGNPAGRHKSIELALCRHIVSQGGRSHVTYEGLALRYGAAHGIGGGNTHHIVVRDCDLSYIGGGHQFTPPGGRPVRFGNAIEFWNSAHDNLVERCRIWEVYDAALTNQGNGPGNTQANITYRHNVIWNCEYSFEYWNRDHTSRTHDIRFEHNTCVDAGHGWAHGQRPDPNGRHLMFYHNSAQTRGFHVRHNIFCNATESCLRLGSPDWSAGLIMDRNCWWQPQGTVIAWQKQAFGTGQFAEYQTKTGKDVHSILADPRFVDAAKLDFRLSADSPARAISATGGPVGALEPQRQD